MSTYPSTLPNPVKASHTPKARNFATDLEGPASYANRERDFSRKVAVEFFLTAEQAAEFYAWWRDELVYGGKWFNCSWPSLTPGPMVAQLVGEPSFDHVYNGAHRISAVVAVRGRSRDVGASDPYWGSVLLLLGFDGAFTDRSRYGRVATVTSPVVTSTADPKFGSASGNFTGGYLQYPTSTDWDFGTDSFTIETWAKFNSASVGYRVYMAGNDGPAGGSHSFALSKTTSNRIGIGGYLTAGSYSLISASSVVPDVWYHIVFQRSGQDFWLHVDGLLEASTTSDLALLVPAYKLGVGITGQYVGTYGGAFGTRMMGELDEFRITRGVARYPSEFAVPTAAFPHYTA